LGNFDGFVHKNSLRRLQGGDEPMPMKLMKQNKGWRPLGRLFAS